MSSTLVAVANWHVMARKAEYKAHRLAQLLNVSVRTLERRFKAQFGLSPHNYLDDLRKLEAERLVREGARTKEIALSIGYSHSSSFCRRFKRQYGASPNLLRAQIAFPSAKRAHRNFQPSPPARMVRDESGDETSPNPPAERTRYVAHASGVRVQRASSPGC